MKDNNKLDKTLFFSTLILLCSSQCLSNYEYYDPMTNLCYPCSTICLTCFSDSICLYCMPYYYLNSNNTCMACSFGCSVCDSSTCTSCNDGLYITANGSCLACDAGVSSCTIATVYTCQVGYFLLGSICAGCFTNCDICSDFLSCTTCTLGYYITLSYSCLKCGTNCLICTSASSCISCEINYVINVGVCQLSNCNTTYPFCISCSDVGCLACMQGKYLKNGVCVQGGSILCLAAYGMYDTNCDTGNYGCPQYAVAQVDAQTQNQMSVCRVVHAAKMYEFVYGIAQTICSSYPCTSPSTQRIVFIANHSFFSIKLFISLRVYSQPLQTLNLSILSQDGTILNSTLLSVNATQYLLSPTRDTTCGCNYGTIYLTSTLLAQSSSSQNTIIINNLNGYFLVKYYILQTSTCQITSCYLCSTAVDCLQCYYPLVLEMGKCLTYCDVGFYLFNRQCLLTCPDTCYTISSSYSCELCVRPCATCSGIVVCSSCVVGYFLENSVCGLTCSNAGLFANTTSRQCYQCPNPCQTCTILTNGTVVCRTCLIGYLFNNSICVFSCPYGYYSDFVANTSVCVICDVACTSCYIAATICLSCADNYLLIGGACVRTTVCASGMYVRHSDNSCANCHYPCSACDTSAIKCTACIKGALFNNTCLAICPISTYISYTNIHNITCAACLAPCSSCLSASLCTSCTTGTFLSQQHCVSSCPTQLYGNTSSWYCNSCIPPCQQCISATVCTVCSTGYLDNTTCTLLCNSTAYVADNFTCQLCVAPCMECYSVSNCRRCNSSYVLYAAACILQSYCITLKRYVRMQYVNGVQIGSICDLCSLPCNTCNVSAIRCLSCVTGYFYLAEQFRCLAICPQGYYANVNNCLACDANCVYCNNSATNCSTCSAGMYLYLSTHRCISACGTGYYNDNYRQTCSLCVSPCRTCYNAYLCSTCSIGLLYNKYCVTTCPEGTLANTTTSVCDACAPTCQSCQNIVSNCTACISGTYYWNGACTATCPATTYGNIYSHSCVVCVSPCNHCTAAAYCIDCVIGYYLSSWSCLTSCPTGTYADSSTATCKSCNLTICSSCTSFTRCITCANGYYYDSGYCLTVCHSGTYGDTLTGLCSACLYPCVQCLSAKYCTACAVSYELFAKQCYSSCPIGYYSNNSVCTACQSRCHICSSDTVCLQCLDGYIVSNNNCVQECPIGQYTGLQGLTNSVICIACKTGCHSCTADMCLVCSSNLLLFNGICLTQCPIFYYSAKSTSNMSVIPAQDSYICLPCPTLCSSCVNTSYCLTCTTAYLYNNKCEANCPYYTYISNNTNCVSCVSPCAQCRGYFECLSCVTGYFYFYSYCVTSCPEDVWYYPQNASCSSYCPYNKFVANMSCYVDNCGSSMVSFGGYCIMACADGYYVNSHQYCTSCNTDNAPCSVLFTADLEIVTSDVLTLVLYFSQIAEVINVADVQITWVTINGNTLNRTYTSYSITGSALVFYYDRTALELVNVTMMIPFVKSTQSAQCIFHNTYSQYILSYLDYSYYSASSILNVISVLLSIGVLLIMLVNIVGRMSHFVQLLDCMQLVAVTLYLEIQYPPILEQFLRGLAPVLFTFMKDAVNIVPYKFSSSKFIYYHVDSTLVRTQLASLIVFALLLGIAISVIAANTYKENWCKKLIPIVKYRGLNDIFCVLLTPLLLFGFHFAHGTKGDIFVSSCVAIAGIGYVTWISYKIGRIKRLYEMPGLLGDFYRTSSTLGLMYTPFAMLRRIILTFVIGTAPFQPISALTLLFVLTFLIMLSVLFYQPFDNQNTDYVTIFMYCSLVGYLFLLMVLALTVLGESASHIVGIIAVILLVTTIGVCFAWLIYITVEHIRTKGFCRPLSEDEEVYYGQGQRGYSKKGGEENESYTNKDQIIEPQEARNESSGNLIIRPRDQERQKYDTTYKDDVDGNDEFRHWSNDSSSYKPVYKYSQLPNFLLKKVYGYK